MRACFACANGVYSECSNLQSIEGDPDHFTPCYNKAMTEPETAIVSGSKNPVGRPVLDNAKVTSLLSTGRKRAALLYPVKDGQICEWAGLKYAGGGVESITGCAGNVLYEQRGKYARHHGPDKNVLENRPGNVHIICPTCHNRWHTLNDPYYGEREPNGQPFLPDDYEALPHDPDTQATDEEIEANEAWWKLNPSQRAVSDNE